MTSNITCIVGSIFFLGGGVAYSHTEFGGLSQDLPGVIRNSLLGGVLRCSLPSPQKASRHNQKILRPPRFASGSLARASPPWREAPPPPGASALFEQFPFLFLLEFRCSNFVGVSCWSSCSSAFSPEFLEIMGLGGSVFMLFRLYKLCPFLKLLVWGFMTVVY